MQKSTDEGKKALKDLEKRKKREKLGSLLTCLSRKKTDNSKNQKESIFQIKRRSICFVGKNVKSGKACSKSGIITVLSSQYPKIKPRLYYRARKKNRRAENSPTSNSILSRHFRYFKLSISKSFTIASNY